jgi:hypothetical protein
MGGIKVVKPLMIGGNKKQAIKLLLIVEKWQGHR